jgi:hypothetical protein
MSPEVVSKHCEAMVKGRREDPSVDMKLSSALQIDLLQRSRIIMFQVQAIRHEASSSLLQLPYSYYSVYSSTHFCSTATGARHDNIFPAAMTTTAEALSRIECTSAHQVRSPWECLVYVLISPMTFPSYQLVSALRYSSTSLFTLNPELRACHANLLFH